MIIGRFKVQSRPEYADELAAAIAAVEAPSRELPGVVHFDVSRSLTDPNTFIAVEVFEDRDALIRQNAQAEVDAMLSRIRAGALTGPMEWTVWEAAG
jgi:quinol monooxygenase YgiN